MATQVQFRGGTTSEHSTFTGVAREVTVDTTKKTVVVHDGSTAGGIPLAKESAVTSAAAITGGSINGTTVGASTASTGAFTTLSASSTVSGAGFSTYLASPPAIGGTTASTGRFTTVTATGLTSGRVTYAGASGLLSDSANLAFDGNNLIVGSGSSSAIANKNIDVNGTGDAAFVLRVGGTTTSYLYSTGGQTILGTVGALPITFNPNGTERMRITSTGNVGIGTSSPTVTLHASASVTNSGGIGTEILRVANTRANTGTSGASISFVTNEIESTNQYIRGQITGEYDGSSNINGRLLFATANTSGTLAERMRISSTGLVGIGTSSPQANLQVTSSAFPVLKVADGLGGGAVALGDSTISSNYVGIWRGAANSISGGGFLNVQGNGIAFMSTDNVFGSATRTMTLDNSGNLGIGTTSPATKLNIENAGACQLQIAYSSTIFGRVGRLSSGNYEFSSYENGGSLLFGTTTTNGSTTERMRITSDGHLLVGTTSDFNSAFTMSLKVNSSTGGLIIQPGADSYTAIQFNNAAGTGVGSISVSSTLTSYNVTSDERLKTNVIDAPTGNIDDIKVRSFDWLSDGSHQEYGMVAQELIEVAPYAVTKPVNPDDMMQVDYSKLVPMMIKEIQDLKAEVNQLKTKIGV